MSVLDRLRTERPEMNLSERIERGRKAAEMLADDSPHQEVMTEVEIQTLEQWRDSRDPEVQQRAWAVVNALKEIDRVMQQIADDGVVAQHLLEQENEEE